MSVNLGTICPHSSHSNKVRAMHDGKAQLLSLKLTHGMKVSYDKISPDYVYLLSRIDLAILSGIVSPSSLAVIMGIRFGCNTKTTQEGRIVQRGGRYEIRINFCLKNNRSRLLSAKKTYQRTIDYFGGKIDRETGLIVWSPESAKRYAFYLLFHEIAHAVYCEQFKGGKLEGHGSPTEESWCDEYAAGALKKLPEAWVGMSWEAIGRVTPVAFEVAWIKLNLVEFLQHMNA